MKCQIMLNRFWMTLAESWHADRPAIPPIVSNIKSKSYLNLLQECHQLKEWSQLIFPGGYPSALPRSGVQRTINLLAAVTQLSWHSSTAHLHQTLLYRPDFPQSGMCSYAGAGGLSLQSTVEERAAPCTTPWQRVWDGTEQ